jgi:Family of unknown function (DUF5681)
MSERKQNYEIGYGKPPAGRRFRKGQSGNPRGPRRKNDLSALLLAALDEPVTLGSGGERRRITAAADLRATKMLIDMLEEAEAKAGTASPEPAKLAPANREVVELFVARLRRRIAAEAAAAAELVVPAKAGTRSLPLARTGEQPPEIPGFPLSRE